MWESSTETEWVCASCDYESNYAMNFCPECDSTSIDRISVDYSDGRKKIERVGDEDEYDDDDD